MVACVCLNASNGVIKDDEDCCCGVLVWRERKEAYRYDALLIRL